MLLKCLRINLTLSRYKLHLCTVHTSAAVTSKGNQGNSDDIFEFASINRRKKDDAPDVSGLDDADVLLDMAQKVLSPEELKTQQFINKITTNKPRAGIPANLVKSNNIVKFSSSSIANIFALQGEKTLSEELYNPDRFAMTYSHFKLEEVYNKSLMQELPGVQEHNRLHSKEEILKVFAQEVQLNGNIGNKFTDYILEKGANRNRQKWKSKKVLMNNKQINERVEKTVSTDSGTETDNSSPGFENSQISNLPWRILRQINTPLINKIARHNLWTAKKFGQPLIIDCRFGIKYNTRPGKAKSQVLRAYSENKVVSDPFHLVFCNVADKHPVIHYMQENVPDLDMCATITNKPYLEMDELLPREDLIYLSPDAPHVMEEFQRDKIYIVGLMVDQPEQPNLTKNLAEAEGIVQQKLPLQKYLNWGGVTGRRSLTICTIMQILFTLKRTNGDWIEALKNIPVRFHSGLTAYAENLIAHDPDTIARFKMGAHLKEHHQPPPQFVPKYKQKEMMAKYFGRFNN
uniref:tRNA (guanine(9)-N(1))-methyltransferase n=1 Tax=Phallusia mammillata TaxID=59560 RepID=A0A6F9DQ29_9ASCI|nr:mitochondrial ribonuclease P protein 1-like [Phallusia mammillata]